MLTIPAVSLTSLPEGRSHPGRREADPGMNAYRVFGGRLMSELEFPTLPSANGTTGTPRWTLARSPDGTPPGAGRPEGLGEVVGVDRVNPDVEVRLYEREGEAVLAYDDTGVFRLPSEGGRITWTPGPGSAPDAVRMDVLGRVLPLALHRAGFLVFHASGVVGDGRALGFLGPKGVGKSTLALCLGARGARVLTDDALPVEVGPPPVGWPGVPTLRLRRDVADLTRGGVDSVRRVEDGRWAVRPGAGSAEGPAPLAALYLLDPVAPGDGGSLPRREPLTGPEAAAALLGQLKLGPLLAGEGAKLLPRCAELAAAIPVFRLAVARDLERLDHICDFLADHHAIRLPRRAGVR